MSINTSNFWNVNNVPYYREEDNLGADYYNTYEDFLMQSKSDAELKKFKFFENFPFTPSYGSSVRFSFVSYASEYGHGYIMQNQSKLNRIMVSYDLRFDSINNSKTKKILDFVDKKGGYEDFSMQSISRDSVSGAEAYKSLFSMRPYMIQNFTCAEKTVTQNYVNNNTVNLSFQNNDFSQLNYKNILYAECLPESRKEIINEYFYKRHLDIQPSYSITREENIATFANQFKNARTFLGWDSKNPHKVTLQLRYDNIDDDSLLKIISLMIGAQGFETFTFNIDDSGTQNVSNFLCQEFTHTFVYNGVHSLSLNLESFNIKRSFN